MKNVILFIALFCFSEVRAQHGLPQKRIDSLKKAIESAEEDTSKLSLLSRLNLLYDLTDGWAVPHMSDKENRRYAHDFLELAQKIGSKKDIANAYNQLGILNNRRHKYRKALRYFEPSLALRKETGAEVAIAGSICNIGIAYNGLKNYDTALQLFDVAENMLIKSTDTSIVRKVFLANTMDNKGSVYEMQGKHDEALKYFLKAAPIFKETGTTIGLVNCYVNTGYVYFKQKKYTEASEFEINAQNLATHEDYILGIKQAKANLKAIERQQQKKKS